MVCVPRYSKYVCALITCSPSSRGLFSIAMEQDVGAVNGLAVFSAELALALPNIVSNSLQTGRTKIVLSTVCLYVCQLTLSHYVFMNVLCIYCISLMPNVHV